MATNARAGTLETVPDLNTIKDWSIVTAGLIALITWMVSSLESRRRGRQERAQNFIMMRRRFLETPQYREILDQLREDSPELANHSIQERRNFVGFLEEVALMTNSKLITEDVAHYMFGYYVCLTHQSTHFWAGMDRDSEYWSLFRNFAERLGKRKSHTDEHTKELAF